MIKSDKSPSRRIFGPSKSKNSLIIFLFEEMRKQNMTIEEMAMKSGYAYPSIRHWKQAEREPSLSAIQTCFSVLGYTLLPQKSCKDE